DSVSAAARAFLHMLDPLHSHLRAQYFAKQVQLGLADARACRRRDTYGAMVLDEQPYSLALVLHIAHIALVGTNGSQLYEPLAQTSRVGQGLKVVFAVLLMPQCQHLVERRLAQRFP